MTLHTIDLSIIFVYFALLVFAGFYLKKRASENLDSYFLGGKSLPWWIIGTSHGASGFDITGTMWFVTMFFTYGLKAAWIPWVWPMFDRIFRQMYLGQWIRRSNVLTGAEWIQTRFGKRGASLSHISVVIYSIVITLGFLGYAYQGIGKFATVFFPWDLSWSSFSSAEMYGLVILAFTSVYLLLGGWYSVVLTDLIQFILLTIAAFFIGIIAMQKVAPQTLQKLVPENWDGLLTGVHINIDWSQTLPTLNDKISADGYSLFGILISMWLLKGLLVSMAGPTPGYGMQHTLSTRNPREAALENWWMSVVQIFPRFFMIAGIGVLGIAFFTPQIQGMLASGQGFDFEQILPFVIRDFIPVGLVGILLAGLLAAFMSTFDSTVNAGAAYIVNDIYKKYINSSKPAKHYVRMGSFVSICLILLAIFTGTRIDSIHSITKMIAVLLYSGYMAPNILKWHWWRFNGYGYFAGMIGGVAAALIVPLLTPNLESIHQFPIILVISSAASILTSLLTPKEDDELLFDFYKTVRPWGFWKPVYEKLQQQDSAFEKNDSMSRDLFNVGNGIVWQLMLTALPITIVIRNWTIFWPCFILLVITSGIMKKTWYDKLEK